MTARTSISSDGWSAIGRRSGRAIGGLSLLLVALFASPARSSTIAQKEYDEKARYLGTFAKFVEWPSTAFGDEISPVTIGVLGSDPFGYSLERALQGEQAGGRRFAVRRFRDVTHLEPCSILFVTKAAEGDMPKVLEKLAGSAVLTVGDSQGFVDRGGIIGFTLDAGRVRFVINPGAAERSGLKISSRLLVVAKVAADSASGTK